MSDRSRAQRMRLFVFAGLVLGLLFAVLYVLFDDDEADQALEQESELRELEGAQDQSGGLSYLRLEKMLRGGWEPGRDNLKAHYKLYYRYPDRSRPLNDDMKHLLDPFRVPQPPRPLYQTARPEESDKPLYYIHEQVSQNVVAGKQPFIAHLTVKDGRNASNVKYDVVSVKVLSDPLTGRVALDQPQYNDSGRDGDQRADDHTYVFVWQPAAATRLAWGELTLSVELKVDDQTFKHEIPFQSSPESAGFFTGRFREAIEDGSLVIYAEVDIRKGGYYQLAANLMHQETGKASHIAFQYGQLQPGIQNIPFLFFGKIFHDKNRQGRFVLRHARGKRHNLPDRGPWAGADKLKHREASPPLSKNEPAYHWMEPYTGEFTTASYTLDVFSEKEYEGEDKEAALQAAENER